MPQANAHGLPPSQNEFTFSARTPIKKPLYPSLDKMPSSLQQQCSQLGYSKKLSNNVLQELDQRAAMMHPRPRCSPFGKSMLSPRVARFNGPHRQRFSKMESISSHYAAHRTKDEEELEKENIPSYDPHSKREGTTHLESSTKRRKTVLGRQDVAPQLSSSKRMNNLQEVLNKPTHRSTTTTSTRQVRQPVSRLPQNTQLNLTQSTSSIKLKPSLSSSKSISNNLSQHTTTSTTTSHLPKSSTFANLSKPTVSSIHRSTSNRNLGQQPARSLRGAPSMNNLSSMTRTTSARNVAQNAKPAWR